MIGRLSGVVAAIDEETVLIDVGGVGYEVYAAPRHLARLVAGEAATLEIETVVREDMIRLYGFENASDRRVFRLLQTVQGVGARHALAVLNVASTDDLVEAVTAGDVATIERAHGVGRKLAQRIAAELAGKIGAAAASGATFRKTVRSRAAAAGAETAAGGGALSPTARADAVSALVNLGYDGIEARRAVGVAVANAGDEPDAARLIRLALRELAPA